MKITNTEVIHLRQEGLYHTGLDGEESHGVENVCLVRIDTDEGITGWADVETQPYLARAAMDGPDQLSFRGLRHTLLGENPFETDRLFRKMYRDTAYLRGGVTMQVISGVINASYDIKGKALGLPLCLLLGARCRERVRAYASTLFRNTPAQMERAVTEYRAKGFTAVKFGWGVFRDDPGRDVELVAAARSAAGPEMELLVDAGWIKPHITVQNTLELARRLEPYRIGWIEDCLHPENYEGYRLLCRESPVPIAAGEQEEGVEGFNRLMETGISFLQPDLSRCGGLDVAKHLATQACLRQTQVVPHAWLTDLLTAASLHFNAWLPHALYLEFNTARGPLARELSVQPIRMKDGYLTVPDKPGLGIDVNPETIDRYRIPQ